MLLAASTAAAAAAAMKRDARGHVTKVATGASVIT